MGTKSESKFLFVADDPCLDFLNTRLMDKGELVDLLEKIDDVADWLKHSSLGETGVSAVQLRKWSGSVAGQQALTATREFRENLREAISRIIAKKRVPDST